MSSFKLFTHTDYFGFTNLYIDEIPMFLVIVGIRSGSGTRWFSNGQENWNSSLLGKKYRAEKDSKDFRRFWAQTQLRQVELNSQHFGVEEHITKPVKHSTNTCA